LVAEEGHDVAVGKCPSIAAFYTWRSTVRAPDSANQHAHRDRAPIGDPVFVTAPPDHPDGKAYPEI